MPAARRRLNPRFIGTNANVRDHRPGNRIVCLEFKDEGDDGRGRTCGKVWARFADGTRENFADGVPAYGGGFLCAWMFQDDCMDAAEALGAKFYEV